MPRFNTISGISVSTMRKIIFWRIGTHLHKLELNREKGQFQAIVSAKTDKTELKELNRFCKHVKFLFVQEEAPNH